MSDANRLKVRQDFYFAMIPEWVLDSTVSPSAIVVYLNLARYANNDRRECYPSKNHLAALSNLHLNTVSKCLDELKEIGAITVKHRADNGLQTSNLYTLHMVTPFGKPLEEHTNFVQPATTDFVPPAPPNSVPPAPPKIGTQTRQENQTRETKQTDTPEDSRSTDFERFWAVYPRRIAKGNAKKAWAKAIRLADAGSIIESAQAFGEANKNTEPKFVPHPATWLNAERWTDEPDPAYIPKSKNADRLAMAKQNLELERAQQREIGR